MKACPRKFKARPILCAMPLDQTVNETPMKTDMKIKCFVAVVACALWCGSAGAQTLNQEMTGLASKLNKALVAKGLTNIAALDFTDLQGQPTELGRFLSEQLTVEMVSTPGVSMLDRANIKSILAEYKLTEDGLVNPTNAKTLGKFAGVDTILIGNVTLLDDGIVLMVKAISTDSAKIAAAGSITFPKTSEIQQLLNRGISSNASAVPATTTAGGGGASYQSAKAIATKDIGSLRVVLKSVLPVTLKDQNGSGVRGIRCSLEFTSRETRNRIVAALNATNERKGNYNITFDSSVGTFGDCGMGVGLRSSLVDSNGDLWSYSSVTGVSIIGVGCAVKDHDPSEIISMLEKQDGLNGASLPMNAKYAYGTPSTIDPGQTISVIMTFMMDASAPKSHGNPEFFQMSSEVVVGLVTTGTKKAYSLHNSTFDRISLPVSQ